MIPFTKLVFSSIALPTSLLAGGVVITSVPDAQHPIAPLTSLGGIPLAVGVQLRVGAFPGMSDEQLLNAAAAGGLTQVTAGFVPFGAASAIGDGVDGAVGGFEIAASQKSGTPQALWVGETVSLLIQQLAGSEFLVARFTGEIFEADSVTGLEQLLSLHVADAKIIVGNRYGTSKFATSPAPTRGAFATWIDSFPSITDPNLRLPTADADADGRSNFLEYATGGNPNSAADPSPCQVVTSENGDFWVRFSRATGLGAFTPVIESSADLVTPWADLEGTIEPDPNPPSVVDGLNWMRIQVQPPLGPSGFFRLKSTSATQ